MYQSPSIFGTVACKYFVKYFKGINYRGGFLTWQVFIYSSKSEFIFGL